MYEDTFIDLDRTFFQLAPEYTDSASSDDIDVGQGLGLKAHHSIDWNNLLDKRRVIVLSEAGSGKTYEIFNRAKQLKVEGKYSFFLRLEHVVEYFESAFEVGTHDEFCDWLASNEEAWLFLDSVDESKLKDESAFEKAVLKLNLELQKALKRVRIFITSRANSWRPKTDLMFCNKKLHLLESEKADKTKLEKKINTENQKIFEVYALEELNKKQVKIFAENKSVANIDEFLNDLERYDAWAYTARPIDLKDIIDYWREHSSIGTPLELNESNIQRRLLEPHQKIKQADNISPTDAENAVEEIAAALTLLNKSNIQIPDGNKNSKGIDVEKILINWSPKKCSALLGRAVFTPPLYSRVRFHHRSARELLTAKWFLKKLNNNGSRYSVENFFFTKKYDLEVIRPNMKDILLWLVLFDKRLRDKACNLEPEIIFEVHDPSALPLDTRERALKDICEKIEQRKKYSGYIDHNAVQKFTNNDLETVILELLSKHNKNSEIIALLMKIVWQGKITNALSLAKVFFSDYSLTSEARANALKAVKAFGSQQDFEDCLDIVSKQKNGVDRDVLAEVINNLDTTRKDFLWLFKILKSTKEKKKYRTDGLTYALENYVKRMSEDLLPDFIKGLNKLLDTPPVIERRYCSISTKFAWLMPIGVVALSQLIDNKSPLALKEPVLSILGKVSNFKTYSDEYIPLNLSEYTKKVKQWPELNRSLFWNMVKEVRASNSERITEFWKVYSIDKLWSFDTDDYETLINDIEQKTFLDDKLIALSLAWSIYRDSNKSVSIKKLKSATTQNSELETKLSQYLNPVKSKEMEAYEKQGKKWEKERKERERIKAKNLEDAKKFFTENHTTVENPECFKQGFISQNQHYLLEKMRESDDSSSTSWTSGNWKALIPEYGEEVAKSFRKGLLNFWRHYSPDLRSEKNKDNSSVPIQVIFGLCGLNIEASEVEAWPENLTPKDIEIAFRYALRELNGFPLWFPKLYECFPTQVQKLLLSEVSWEFNAKKKKEDKFYLINKISWDAEWMFADIANDLFSYLKKEPKNLEDLENLLKIVSKSHITDTELEKLASRKCRSLKNYQHLAKWYGLWLGVEPKSALQHLEKSLKQIKDISTAQEFAMNVITNLSGTRESKIHDRRNYLEPEHLCKLYLLMSKYIKPEDDIERAGKGAYSPELRDHAQEARNHLFHILKEIPGKGTYTALRKIAVNEKRPDMRLWLENLAKNRAEADSNFVPQSLNQFLETDKNLEFTPVNHEQLYDLAKQKIIDFRHDIEEADDSIAATLLKEREETNFRNYISAWCNDRSDNKYQVTQEEEFADSKKPDLRFHGNSFNMPVPIELKLVDNNWSGSKLFERLENQLCGDYLRDNNSNYGIFLLVTHGEKKTWKMPNGSKKANFEQLTKALQEHWISISDQFPNIEEISVIGINLTKRFK